MTSEKVADLTVDEFRALVQEIVVHTLSEMLGDPDEGAELREDFRRGTSVRPCRWRR